MNAEIVAAAAAMAQERIMSHLSPILQGMLVQLEQVQRTQAVLQQQQHAMMQLHQQQQQMQQLLLHQQQQQSQQPPCL